MMAAQGQLLATQRTRMAGCSTRADDGCTRAVVGSTRADDGRTYAGG